VPQDRATFEKSLLVIVGVVSLAITAGWVALLYECGRWAMAHL
jgi:hypothetical protein